jgi:hypothetical protein
MPEIGEAKGLEDTICREKRCGEGNVEGRERERRERKTERGEAEREKQL